MSTHLPREFPVESVMDLLSSIPPDLAVKYDEAVKALKQLCSGEYLAKEKSVSLNVSFFHHLGPSSSQKIFLAPKQLSGPVPTINSLSQSQQNLKQGTTNLAG
jgi:hypothetical protein